jgi:hypothetical protein
LPQEKKAPCPTMLITNADACRAIIGAHLTAEVLTTVSGVSSRDFVCVESQRQASGEVRAATFKSLKSALSAPTFSIKPSFPCALREQFPCENSPTRLYWWQERHSLMPEQRIVRAELLQQAFDAVLHHWLPSARLLAKEVALLLPGSFHLRHPEAVLLCSPPRLLPRFLLSSLRFTPHTSTEHNAEMSIRATPTIWISL